MIRLPDTYYTTQMLDGQPEQTGIYQLSPTFYQGEDVIINFYLQIDGAPVTLDHWDVSLIVKKSNFANNILWSAFPGNGLIPRVGGKDGYFEMIMPAAISSLFLPGSYYMALKTVENPGTGNPKDRTIVPLQAYFNLELSAASPNPKLRATVTTELIYDIYAGTLTTQTTSVEPTLPIAANIDTMGGGPNPPITVVTTGN